MIADSSSHTAHLVAENSDDNHDHSSLSTLSNNLTTESNCFLALDEALLAAEEMEFQRQIGSVYLEDGDDAVSQLLLAAQSGNTDEILSLLNAGIEVDATRMVSDLYREE